MQFAIKSTTHRVTGKSPGEVLFGYPLRRGGLDVVGEYMIDECLDNQSQMQRHESRQHVADRITDHQNQYASRFNANRKLFPEYIAGDFMSIQQTTLDMAACSKLSKLFTGPYLILKVLDRDRYVVGDILGNPREQRVYELIISLKRLKPYNIRCSKKPISKIPAKDSTLTTIAITVICKSRLRDRKSQKTSRFYVRKGRAVSVLMKIVHTPSQSPKMLSSPLSNSQIQS